ncbi:MAG: LamG domain-containing protein [Deltaproteobacteria bacterium]|nr:LamG domain-containing protein [Deltaproteobacteria bacterium]
MRVATRVPAILVLLPALSACLSRTLLAPTSAPRDGVADSDPGPAAGDHDGNGNDNGGSDDPFCPAPISLAALRCDLPVGPCARSPWCTGLVALYHFDNVAADGESPTAVHDYSGRGSHLGCLAPDCPVPVTGVVDGGFAFADPQYFAAPDQASLDSSDTVTVSAWFCPAALTAGDWHVIVAKIQPTPLGSNFYLGHLGGQLGVTFHDGVTWHNHLTASSYAPGGWYHLVAVIDSVADRVRLYVNGDLALDDSETANMAVDDGSLWVGWGPGDLGVNGSIDELAIWGRALGDAEIAGLGW